MNVKNIETFFLNTLLRVSIVGISLILISDAILYPEDKISLGIDVTILSAAIVGYVVRSRYPVTSVFIITLMVLAAMIYQCIMVPVNTTTSLSIILLVGFIYSVMLKGKTMLIMHAVTFLIIHMIFVIQYVDPAKRFSSNINDVITVSITYSIIYFNLTYATAILKGAYDRLFSSLQESHHELHNKAMKITIQNEELIQTQENLNSINAHLEKIIDDRTAKIRLQNEVLMKYSYSNAHHLRGPVARLLGLASISRLDGNVDMRFIIEKMEEQAVEIDHVVKQINKDLETADLQKTAPGPSVQTEGRTEN
jgi:hypothetical protein